MTWFEDAQRHCSQEMSWPRDELRVDVIKAQSSCTQQCLIGQTTLPLVACWRRIVASASRMESRTSRRRVGKSSQCGAEVCDSLPWSPVTLIV